MAAKHIDETIFQEIVESMERISNDLSVFLDTQTGETITITQMELDLIDDGDENASLETADWQQEISVKNKQVLENLDGRFLKLPDAFEIHQWKIMAGFAHLQSDDKIATKLDRALQGSGAFGRFEDLLSEFGLKEEWFEFRHEAFRKIALEWCEANELVISETKV